MAVGLTTAAAVRTSCVVLLMTVKQNALVTATYKFAVCLVKFMKPLTTALDDGEWSATTSLPVG